MADARRMVWQRCGGRCEVCGAGVSYDSMEAHHRLTRRHGADCPCNLLGLCRHCHHVRVHGEPASARAAGWIVSRTAQVPPGERPVMLTAGLVLLGCDGRARTCDGIILR